jgi:hypothetical protein
VWEQNEKKTQNGGVIQDGTTNHCFKLSGLAPILTYKPILDLEKLAYSSAPK